MLLHADATYTSDRKLDEFYRVLKQAFSENGSLLASVGQDDNHCLAVHDWEKGKLQHTGPSDARVVSGEGGGPSLARLIDC